MRVLLLARYLQMVNHRKVRALAAQPGVQLWHIAPKQWSDGFRTYKQELQHSPGYHFIATDTLPRNRDDIHRFIYWPPTLYLPAIKPDIIQFEEEPDSIAALEVVLARRLLAPLAKLVIFTWQNVRRQRNAVVEQLAHQVLRYTDYAIAGNSQAADVLREQDYRGPITVLPQLGVDTSTFKPQDATTLRGELGLHSFVVGYVGRLIPGKGVDLIIKAAAQVKECQVLILGRGPQKSEIEALAQSLGLENRLTIVAAVPHHKVPAYINAMDVLVLPSRTQPKWQEQFGHVLIEAMACGTPVIGSNSGAIPAVINSAGLIFPEEDVAALINHLRSLINDRDSSYLLSQRGIERVKARYTHERIAEQTVRIYRKLLSEE